VSSRIRLGHKQVLTVDGVALEGVRELDLDVSTRSVEVTGWASPWASYLPAVIDPSLTVTLYYPEEMNVFWTNLKSPVKSALTIAVSGLFSGRFVVSGIAVGCPMGGVVPHQVTLKQFAY